MVRKIFRPPLGAPRAIMTEGDLNEYLELIEREFYLPEGLSVGAHPQIEMSALAAKVERKLFGFHKLKKRHVTKGLLEGSSARRVAEKAGSVALPAIAEETNREAERDADREGFGRQVKVIRQEAPYDTPFAGNMGYAMSDPSGLVRNTYGLAMATLGKTPDVGVQALGLTGTFGVITGVSCAIGASKDLEYAEKVGDYAGANIARIQIVRGAVETASGLVAVPVKMLPIVAMNTAAKTHVMATAQMGLGTASFGLSVGIYTLLSLPLGYNVLNAGVRLRKLNQIFDGAGRDRDKLTQALDLLFSEAEFTPKGYDKIFSRLKEFNEPGLRTLLGQTIQVDPEEFALLTHEDREWVKAKTGDVLRKFYDEAHLHHPGDEFELDYENVKDHVALNLSQAMINARKGKNAQIIRAYGSDALHLVVLQMAMKPENRLTANMDKLSDEEVGVLNGIFTKVRDGMFKDIRFNSIVIVTCIIGIIGFILVNVFTAGTPFIIGMAISIFVSVMMLILDGYCLAQSMKTMRHDNKNKIIFGISLAIVTISTILGAVFGVTLVAKLVAVIVGVLSAGMHGAALWKLMHIEQKERESDRDVTGRLERRHQEREDAVKHEREFIQKAFLTEREKDGREFDWGVYQELFGVIPA